MKVKAPITDWDAVYRPLLGKRLEQVVFCPITCDTLNVVRDLEEPVVNFSGSVLIGFEAERELVLGWQQASQHDFALTPQGALRDRWERFAVDQVCMSQEEPWVTLCGAPLARVDIYEVLGEEGVREVAAAHRFAAPGAPTLWVATAIEDSVAPGNDLLVGVGDHPFPEAPLVLKVSVQ